MQAGVADDRRGRHRGYGPAPPPTGAEGARAAGGPPAYAGDAGERAWFALRRGERAWPGPRLCRAASRRGGGGGALPRRPRTRVMAERRTRPGPGAAAGPPRPAPPRPDAVRRCESAGDAGAAGRVPPRPWDRSL